MGIIIGVREHLYIETAPCFLTHHVLNWSEEWYVCIFILWHRGGASIWNPSLWIARTHLSYIVNAMAADDLVMQGARACADMVMAYF